MIKDLRHSSAVRFAAVAIMLTGKVFAQTSEAGLNEGEESRRALLVEAHQARSASDHVSALKAAERAGAIRMSSSLRRFIAEEQFALGQTLTAHESAVLCVKEANQEPPSQNRDAVLAGCEELERELTRRLAFEKEASVESAAGEARDIPVPASSPPKVSQQQARGVAPVQEHVKPSAPAVVSKSNSAPRAPTWIGPALIGLGVLSAATGVTLYLVSDKKHESFKNQCEKIGCAENSPEQREIETLDLWSNVGIFGGLALGAAGGAYLLISKSQGPTTSASTPHQFRVSGSF